jgi:3-hydroxymyristoyl/3-hydroxydecanoyl-(acyl carrier protein) dehydratase
MSTAPQPFHGEFTVAPDHPCLPGHFPAGPIVPAVLLLDLSCAALLRARPELGVLREVRAAKFLRPVRPGEAVRVTFEFAAADAAGLVAARFSCDTGAGVAAQGQLRFVAP